MGCCCSSVPPVVPKYTAELLTTEFAKLDPHLKRCSYSGPGVLSIEGVGGFFSTKPPLNVDWLCGALSPDEFTQAVRKIDQYVLDALLGLPIKFTVEDIPARTASSMAAAVAGAAAVSETFKGKVLFWVDDGSDSTTVTGVSGGGGRVMNGHGRVAPVKTSTVHSHSATLQVVFPKHDGGGAAAVVVPTPPPGGGSAAGSARDVGAMVGGEEEEEAEDPEM